MNYNFVRNLIKHFFHAKNYRHGGFRNRLRVFGILNGLYMRSLLQGNDVKEVTYDIFGHRVSSYGYEMLLFLFKEIFINAEYHFESDKPDPRIIDCGANIGMAVIYFKTLYPDCSIIAFEPNPSTFRLLEKNIGQNGLRNVIAHNIGLANEEGSIDFYPGSHLGSLTGSIHSSRSDREHMLTIETRKLSGFLKDERPDLVKIDIEGAETEVLKDLDSTGTVNNAHRYSIEYHHRMKHTGSSLSAFLEPFERNGFEYNINASYQRSEQFQDILIILTKESAK